MLNPAHPEWSEVIDEGISDLPDITQRMIRAQGQREAEQGLISSPYEVISRSHVYRDRFAKLYMICGPSGVGKTTWIQTYHPNAEVISMDQIRLEVTGSVSDQSQNRKVYQVATQRLKSLLTSSREIVWDATNIRKVHRERLTQLAYNYNAFVRIDVLCAPAQVAISRNKDRERQLSPHIIHEQYRRWEWPTADEAHEVGYWYLNPKGKWDLSVMA